MLYHVPCLPKTSHESSTHHLFHGNEVFGYFQRNRLAFLWMTEALAQAFRFPEIQVEQKLCVRWRMVEGDEIMIVIRYDNINNKQQHDGINRSTTVVPSVCEAQEKKGYWLHVVEETMRLQKYPYTCNGFWTCVEWIMIELDEILMGRWDGKC